MTSRITKIQEMRKQIAELELVKTRLDNLNVDELPDDAREAFYNSQQLMIESIGYAYGELKLQEFLASKEAKPHG